MPVYDIPKMIEPVWRARYQPLHVAHNLKVATPCRESNPVPTLCTPIQQPVGVSNPRFMTENHESYR